MNIHEFQAKKILSKFGVCTLKGATTQSNDPIKIKETIETAGIKTDAQSPFVAKVQIHAGGRGKAGGVKLVKNIDEAAEFASQWLGNKIVTKQTGETGKVVNTIFFEEGCNIKKELYVSLLVDRESGMITFIASTEGGMDIEEVAEKTPEKIIKMAIDPKMGFSAFHGRKLAYGLGLNGDCAKKAAKLFAGLYRAFTATDASLIEINPLVVTGSEKEDVIALDAKMSFDDNALFRHPDIAELLDESEEDAMELEAKKDELNYIKLDGEIGCMVNGAGLAMATMDVIKLYGSDPANFLDVGGSATTERVSKAFQLILSDKNVKGILVNIFGGIMRCDVIAQGIIDAAKKMQIDVPLVVRLEGTNVELGKKILDESDIKVESASELSEAAEKIVKAVKEAA